MPIPNGPPEPPESSVTLAELCTPIIGIVGAGGIGLQLSEQIRTYDFDQVAFAVIMILITVAAIDWISGKLRFAIIGRRAIA